MLVLGAGILAVSLMPCVGQEEPKPDPAERPRSDCVRRRLWATSNSSQPATAVTQRGTKSPQPIRRATLLVGIHRLTLTHMNRRKPI